MIRLATLYLAFFLSGAAALAYESVWTRYLGLLVGHDAYAQVLVLVIFLGGMSAGAALTARHTTRIRHPLVGYALSPLEVLDRVSPAIGRQHAAPSGPCPA